MGNRALAFLPCGPLSSLSWSTGLRCAAPVIALFPKGHPSAFGSRHSDGPAGSVAGCASARGWTNPLLALFPARSRPAEGWRRGGCRRGGCTLRKVCPAGPGRRGAFWGVGLPWVSVFSLGHPCAWTRRPLWERLGAQSSDRLSFRSHAALLVPPVLTAGLPTTSAEMYVCLVNTHLWFE